MEIDVENIDLQMICDNLGFEVNPHHFRGRKTNFMEISRNDRFITIVSNRYKLVPNEVALTIADDVADRVNAKRIGHYNDDQGDNIIVQYLLDEFETARGVKARAGFYVTNSVGGFMSFRIKSFLLYDNKIIYLGSLISGIVRRHTKNIDIDMDGIVETAREAVETAKKFAYTIDTWRRISVAEGSGIGLVENIRVSNIPNVYRPTYLLKPTKRVNESEIPSTPPYLSLFQMYMDIVHSINNPPTDRLSEKGKITYFNMLHKALEEEI
jgi:hypothetical protein